MWECGICGATKLHNVCLQGDVKMARKNKKGQFVKMPNSIVFIVLKAIAPVSTNK